MKPTEARPAGVTKVDTEREPLQCYQDYSSDELEQVIFMSGTNPICGEEI